jgi:hypothetical protein
VSATYTPLAAGDFFTNAALVPHPKNAHWALALVAVGCQTSQIGCHTEVRQEYFGSNADQCKTLINGWRLFVASIDARHGLELEHYWPLRYMVLLGRKRKLDLDDRMDHQARRYALLSRLHRHEDQSLERSRHERNAIHPICHGRLFR